MSRLHVARFLLTNLAALLGAACGAAPTHDWPSPAVSREHRRPAPPQQDHVAQPWSGLLWAGPHSGAPAAPSASHCSRAPQPFEVEDPAPHRRAQASAERRAADSAGGLSPRFAESELRDKGTEGLTSAAPAAASKRFPHAVMQNTPMRPADEPVSAGMVNDNADFGAYLAYQQRWAHLPKREMTVAQRVRLDVRDGQGRAVPDAQVTVWAAGQALPIWARTDAAGQAWLMPQADSPGSVFEVQVDKAGQLARVLWQRGQKDNLQVVLSNAPLQPARLDLLFLVDATGSMADEIDKLKRSLKSIAEQIAQLPSRPDLCLALVAYRDRGDAFFVRGTDFSNNLQAFQNQLGQLHAGGGGDYPEALSEALHMAVHRLSWRGEGTARLLVLLADAPPHLDHGAPYYDHDLRAAAARGVKIISVGASGLDPQGEFILRQAAQFTGGRFVFLTYDKARQPSSGPGRETVHDVNNYSVETLDKLVVRVVREELAPWPSGVR